MQTEKAADAIVEGTCSWSVTCRCRIIFRTVCQLDMASNGLIECTNTMKNFCSTKENDETVSKVHFTMWSLNYASRLSIEGVAVDCGLPELLNCDWTDVFRSNQWRCRCKRILPVPIDALNQCLQCMLWRCMSPPVLYVPPTLDKMLFSTASINMSPACPACPWRNTRPEFRYRWRCRQCSKRSDYQGILGIQFEILIPDLILTRKS